MLNVPIRYEVIKVTMKNNRSQLHRLIDQLPDDLVEEIVDFTLFLMARRQISPDYEDWKNKDWQDFVLEQFFCEDDEVEYLLEDAQEIF
jgi:hypothetical protein